jgi:hypothetical protein
MLVSSLAHAQQMWGMMGSNYAGVSNIDLNPSNMVTSRLGWDFNIISFDANLYNNSFYADPQFIFPLFFKDKITFSSSNKNDPEKMKSADVFIKDDIQQSNYVAGNAIVKGPSFMYNNGRYAYAFTSAFRSGMSSFGLPYDAVKLGYQNLDYAPLMNQPLALRNGLEGAGMAWLELGGSYARRLSESRDFLLTGGASLKLLIGYAGGHALSSGINYSVPYAANFTTTNLNMDYSHAVNSDKKPVSIFNPLGIGASMDIGITIMRKKGGKNPFYGCPMLTRKTLASNNVNYKWKLGLSLIDLGGIQFANHAAVYSYSNVAYSWDSVTNVKVKTLAEVDQLLLTRFGPNGDVAVKNAMFIWTPTAISAQFDYNYNDLIFINAAIIQRLVVASQARLARMNSIALTPRYETSGLEIAMPIIVNEYLYPTMGLMVRFKYFFIGTDQLGSTFGITRLNGLDLYMGFKISNFGRNKQPRVSY